MTMQTCMSLLCFRREEGRSCGHLPSHDSRAGVLHAGVCAYRSGPFCGGKSRAEHGGADLPGAWWLLEPCVSRTKHCLVTMPVEKSLSCFPV